MSITLYKIGEPHFPLLGTNGFQVKAKSERFTAASSRCRQNLKYENFTSSFGRLRQNIAPKSVPHVQHDYFSSLNQSNHWFVALSLTLPSSKLKLPIPPIINGQCIGRVSAAISTDISVEHRSTCRPTYRSICRSIYRPMLDRHPSMARYS